jgi:hypothetical protein
MKGRGQQRGALLLFSYSLGLKHFSVQTFALTRRNLYHKRSGSLDFLKIRLEGLLA